MNLNIRFKFGLLINYLFESQEGWRFIENKNKTYGKF